MVVNKKRDSHPEHHEAHHSEHVSHKPKERPTKVIRRNPWIIFTIILLILVIVILILNYSGKSSGEKVGKNFVNFINSKGDAKIEYVNASAFSSDLYEVTVSSQGKEIPVYITKDGEYFVQIVAKIEAVNDSGGNQGTNPPDNTNIVKSNRPSIDLFIWGYCPYGVTAQGPLSEVANLLSNYADFRAVMYYAGHGEHEVEQNKIQECIQKVSPDKYWDYAGKFVEEIYPKCGPSRDVSCDLNESIALMNSLGINSDSVMDCVKSEGDALSKTDSALAHELGVKGSPTLVINGKIVNVARNADAYKKAVCEAFNNPPEACGTNLTSQGSTASGNC